MRKQKQAFKALQQQWYKRLKASGFHDQEDEYQRMRRHTPTVDFIETKVDFYRIAGQFLYDYDFKSELHRRIWEMFCDGLGREIISRELKGQFVKTKRSKLINLATVDRVRSILVKLKKEFALYRYVREYESDDETY